MIRLVCERLSGGENRLALMNFEWVRYESFQHFPLTVPVSPLILAKNGFYYVGNGHNDKVKCFSCSVIHGDWNEDDIPWEIHKTLSPECEFVRDTDGNNVPIHEQSNPGDHASAPRTGTPPERGRGTGSYGATGGSPLDTGSPVFIGTYPTPKFKDFETGVARSLSFSGWPRNSNVNAEILASAGFYYTGRKDTVRCFDCGLALRNWEEGDDPLIEHARYYPWCNFLLAQNGTDFVMEHSDHVIDFNEKAPKDHSSSTTAENVNTGETGAHARARNQREHEDGIQDVAGGLEDVAQNEPRADALAQENEQLKSQMMCKICLDNEKNVVFLPCAHMVSCQRCAPQITKCPICRQQIVGRKKIFLS